MDVTQQIIFLLSLVNIGLFLFLLVVTIRQWERSVGTKYFFFIVLFSFLWLLSVNLDALDKTSNQINYVYSVVDLVTATFVAFFFAQFSWNFPKRLHQISIVRIIKYTLLLLALIFPFLTDFFPRNNAFLGYTEKYYAIYIFCLGVLALLYGGSGVLKNLRSSSGIEKKQLQYVSVGYLVPMGLLVLFSAYASLMHDVPPEVYVLFSNIGLMFSLITVRAISRYRFMDIRLMIRRGTVRLLSFLVVFAIYLLLVAVIARPLFEDLASVAPVTYVALGLIVLLTVEPLRKYVTGYVDKLFVQHDTKVEQVKQRLEVQLRSEQAYEGLHREIQSALQQVAGVATVEFAEHGSTFKRFHPSTWAFAKLIGKVLVPEEFQYRLDEDEQYAVMRDEFANDATSAVVPVGQGDSFVGCYVLGTRQGKGAYSIEDIQALANLQKQFTSAFLSARLYKQAVERIVVKD